MKQDKFLTGILLFIGLLVIAALILFFGHSQPQVRTDNTPEAAVFNFILALQQEDYEQAYAYLVEAPGKPSLTTFEQYYRNNLDLSRLAVDVGETRLRGERASVELILTQVASEPFGGEWTSEGTALLVRQEGRWKIEGMPWQFWGWDWYAP